MEAIVRRRETHAQAAALAERRHDFFRRSMQRGTMLATLFFENWIGNRNRIRRAVVVEERAHLPLFIAAFVMEFAPHSHAKVRWPHPHQRALRAALRLRFDGDAI